MNETRLRDLLEQAAPDRPDVDPTSRTASVVRRGRTARVRDRALVAVAAVSVVAVAVAVPISAGDGDGPDRATPAPPSPVQVEPCPTVAQDTEDLAQHGALPTVTGGFDAVRSCPALDAAGEPLPDAPLVGDAARAFAEDLTALPDFELPSFCMVANVMPQPWVLQVQEGDGLLSIGSPVRVCGSVSVAGRDVGVDQVLAAFAGNLERQESGIPELACPATEADAPSTWNASFDPATATAGVLCVSDRDGAWAEEATLTAGEVASVKDDMATNLREALGGACDQPIETPRLLVLADDAGDQAAYLDLGCEGGFTNARGTWVPGAGTVSGLTR
ncbi:hypothetical protein [Nocardioides sp. SR21]|uniref:hypothetical protein n=1 Tax=Nocardioides sp. SR21 TaxID=2919501 RepID=UPI001FAB164D|nr:hypothetical protein [Nocardioides sp. SR21]